MGLQCVELAARLYAAKSWGSVHADGPSGDPYRSGAKYLPEGSPTLTFFPNGTGYIPVPGDLIVETNSTWGHVAVVDSVDGSKVSAVEQNASVTGYHTYTLTGSTIAGAFSGSSVRGVLHSPSNPAVVGSVGRLAAVQNQDGLLEVFGVKNNGAVFHKWQLAGGGWSDWAGMDGTLTSVAAAKKSDGRAEIFGTGSAGDAFHRWQLVGGGWSSWGYLGGSL